jgi:Fe-S cluster assembly protein SufD
LESWSSGGQRLWPEGIEPLEGADLEAHLGEVLAATGTAPHWTVELNRAIAQGVLALRIRPGVSTCLELVSDSEGQAGVQPHRLLLVLEEGASLDLLQVHRASGPSLTSVVLEVQLKRKASLRHGLLAHGGSSSALLAVTAVSQAPEATTPTPACAQAGGWHGRNP